MKTVHKLRNELVQMVGGIEIIRESEETKFTKCYSGQETVEGTKHSVLLLITGNRCSSDLLLMLL